MSLQWTLVASVLYVEIALVLLMTLPILPPRRWHALFKSRFLQVLSQQAQWYFGFLVFALTLLLLDAIREMRKYSHSVDHDHPHALDMEAKMGLHKFRADRNFYISGFALFLMLVLRRLVTLISAQAVLMAEKEAALKQAQSASTAARGLMEQERRGEAAQNLSNEAHQEEVTKLEARISLLEDKLEKSNKEKQAVIDQAKGVETEYDRLSEEHKKLQLKLKVYGDGDKKDE